MDMEQKKPRKRLNFFDLLIVLLLLAVVAVAYLLSHDSTPTAKNIIPRTYTVELPRLELGMKDYVSVGDTVTDNIKNYAIGTVTDIELQPSTNTVLDEEHEIFRQAVLNDRVTLVLTIEVDTVETDSAVDTLSGYTLRTGTSVSLTAGQLYAAGTVLSVSR